MNKHLSIFFLTLNTLLLSASPTPSIPETVDDFLYGLRAACMPEELLQNKAYTQLIIDYLITLPHTKDNPIFAAAKLATQGAALWLQDYLQDPEHMKVAEYELVIACSSNDLSVIDMLLQAGVNPNACINSKYETPLIAALEKDNNRALETLVKAGANNFEYPSIPFDPHRPITIAACHDNYQGLSLMLKANADPDKKLGIRLLDEAKHKKTMKDFLLAHGYQGLYEIDHSQYGTAVGYWVLCAEYEPDTKKYIRACIHEVRFMV